MRNTYRLCGVLAALSIFVATSHNLMGMSVGDAASDFSAKNQDGKVVRLSDYRGKPVLLYFYPMDNTSGCTKEASSFKNNFSKFKEAGAVIFGISKQSKKSHQAFRAKYELPFDLLVDADGAIAKAYGIDTVFLLGIHKRQSVLIGRNGKVLRIYKDVDPVKHSDEVLKDLAGA